MQRQLDIDDKQMSLFDDTTENGFITFSDGANNDKALQDKQEPKKDIEIDDEKELEIAREIYRIFKDNIDEIYDIKNNKLIYKKGQK